MTDMLPGDANPDNLLELCVSLREGGKTREELYEDVDIGESVIRDTINYGQNLGFLEEAGEEELSITDRGMNLAYQDEIDEQSHLLFRDGLKDFDLYRELSEAIINELLDKADEENVVIRDHIIPILRTEFGFEDRSDSRIESGTNAYLATLQAAGFGEYIVGRGGKSTRIELTDEFLDFFQEEPEDPESSTGKDRREADIDSDEGEQTGERVEEDVFRKQEASKQSIGHPVEEVVTVDIQIQISSEDWDSDDVVKLLKVVGESEEVEIIQKEE